MAPSRPLLARLKKALKRVQTWRPGQKAVPEQTSAPPTNTKASVPEQPQAATRQPIIHQDQAPIAAASTMPTLQIALQNNTTSNQVYAYISEHSRRVQKHSESIADIHLRHQLAKPSTTTVNCLFFPQTPKQPTIRHRLRQPGRRSVKTSPSHLARQETL